MRRKVLWTVTSQIEVRFKLQNDFLGTDEDETFTRELQSALAEALARKRLGRSAGAETGRGRTSVYFEGDSAGAMLDAVAPVLKQFRKRRPLMVLLRHGELYREAMLLCGAPMVERPASMVITLRFGKGGRMKHWEIDATSKLLMQIEKALDASGAGWLDGDGFGGSFYDIFCYGEATDALWEAVEPLLEPYAERDITVSLSAERVVPVKLRREDGTIRKTAFV